MVLIKSHIAKPNNVSRNVWNVRSCLLKLAWWVNSPGFYWSLISLLSIELISLQRDELSNTHTNWNLNWGHLHYLFLCSLSSFCRGTFHPCWLERCWRYFCGCCHRCINPLKACFDSCDALQCKLNFLSIICHCCGLISDSMPLSIPQLSWDY